MFMFSKREKELNDRVIVFNGEQVTIYPVLNFDEEVIHCEGHVFPMADATTKFDTNGGIVFLFNCNLVYLQDTQHLANVEESRVLNKVFDFTQRDKWEVFYKLMYVIAFIMIIWIVRK